VAEREVGLQAALKIDSPPGLHTHFHGPRQSPTSQDTIISGFLTISGSGVVGQTFSHELRAITH
jgi:hypothetical protein